MATTLDNPYVPSESQNKKRVIPKERYLGVYFKISDQDLIDWKKGAGDENLTEFTKDAIREKLQRKQEAQKFEHPVLILRRLEAQQGELFVMLQRVLSLLSGGQLTGIRIAEGDALSMTVEATAAPPNNLDEKCSEAGWE